MFDYIEPASIQWKENSLNLLHRYHKEYFDTSCLQHSREDFNYSGNRKKKVKQLDMVKDVRIL